METNERHIVAIDLGTSKMALTVAKVNGNDKQIIYYKEAHSAGIKYSGVYNSAQASSPLSFLIKDAEESLGIKINQAVIGMPKFPIRQEANSGKVIDRGEDTEITAEDINDIKRFAQETYPLKDPAHEAIYGAVAQSFSDGEYFQIIEDDIIGMTSDVLEGHFKIFIGRKRDLKNADNLLIKTGITSKKKYFTAETTAKAVLTDLEMENGVALIDFGGGSTSVTIYQGNIMRHYASIPFGGKNITNDIKTELQITERLAENIKLAYGACMPDKLLSLSEKVLYIKGNTAQQSKEVTVKYLSEIITARVEEIVQAMLYEISESGLAENLRGGIVVTGGASQTANLGMLIKQMSGYNVRIGHPLGLLSCQDIEGIGETTAATSVGLINAAIEDHCMNCAVCDETYHTEVETVVESVPTEEEVTGETSAVTEETATETITVEYTEPVKESEKEEEEVEVEVEVDDEDVDEDDDDDDVENEGYEEELEEEDDDYDEELEDEPRKPKKPKRNKEGGLLQKLKFIWNKLGDDTDDIIKDLAK